MKTHRPAVLLAAAAALLCLAGLFVVSLLAFGLHGDVTALAASLHGLPGAALAMPALVALEAPLRALKETVSAPVHARYMRLVFQNGSTAGNVSISSSLTAN